VHLQEVGAEFGVTTGRRRRCGWLDLVVLRYSNLINGYTSLNLTKLDVLDTLPLIKIAVGYSIDGVPLDSFFPADLALLDKVEVEYVEMEGWMSSIEEVKVYEDLPVKCKAYVEFIEKFLGVPIGWIGVGPAREAMITKAY
jgi:adenylosuccinate synthase